MIRTNEALSIALVRRAARTAPRSVSARLEEEWLADMHERTSGLSRLRFAVGCYWASVAIGLEHRTAGVAVASTAAGNVSLIVEPPSFFSSRAVTFGLVLSLHAAVFAGLMMARTQFSKPAEPAALQPRVIDRPLPPVKSPPVETRRSFFDKFTVIPKLPPVELPPEPTVPKIVSDPPVPPQPPGTTGTSPSREIVRVQGGVGPAFPHPGDYYPDASRRAEEQGAAVLRVCVDAAGRLIADPVGTESSGSGRLDAAAIKLARAGSGHYRPTTEDGRPVTACYPIKIRFELRN
jgi:periplasmic protein TonB